jgi:predicted GNAT superfamily acetyltransferase
MTSLPAIRLLDSVEDADRAELVLRGIWGDGISFSPEMLFAVGRFGGYLSAAEVKGEMVGVCFGFLGDGGTTLHSHVTGVAASHAGQGIGFALKQHQRGWAAERGISTITWTFDPLVRRNAWFNLAKLGARPVDYFEDFYGRMTDDVNAEERSDRLFASWDVITPVPGVVDVPSGVAVAVDPDTGESHTVAPHAGWLLIPTPPDVESLRRADGAASERWRASVHRAFTWAFDAGGAVAGITRGGSYLLTMP